VLDLSGHGIGWVGHGLGFPCSRIQLSSICFSDFIHRPFFIKPQLFMGWFFPQAKPTLMGPVDRASLLSVDLSWFCHVLGFAGHHLGWPGHRLGPADDVQGCLTGLAITTTWDRLGFPCPDHDFPMFRAGRGLGCAGHGWPCVCYWLP
jgi:hypothetical protein